MSMVSVMVGGWDSRKNCSEFTCELVRVFVIWLAINLGDFKFLNAFFDVLFNARGCNR